MSGLYSCRRADGKWRAACATHSRVAGFAQAVGSLIFQGFFASFFGLKKGRGEKERIILKVYSYHWLVFQVAMGEFILIKYNKNVHWGTQNFILSANTAHMSCF